MDLIETSVKNPIEHWYYKHKFRFISKVFRNSLSSSIHLADIGAGSALFSKELIKNNIVDSAMAIDTGYQREYFNEEDQISYLRSAKYSDVNYFLLTDVLEHVEDDFKFLHQIVAEAIPGSVFIVTVPALQSLWSGHDVYLKHFRRYSRQELRGVVKKSGLDVVSVRYTYSTVFPFAYLQRKFAGRQTASQMKESSWLLSKLLTFLLIPDRFLTFLPFGVSLFLVAEKPK